MKLLWLEARWKGLQGQGQCTPATAHRRRPDVLGGILSPEPHFLDLYNGDNHPSPHCAGGGGGGKIPPDFERAGSLGSGAEGADPTAPTVCACLQDFSLLYEEARYYQPQPMVRELEAPWQHEQEQRRHRLGPATAWWCRSRPDLGERIALSGEGPHRGGLPRDRGRHVQLGQRWLGQDPHHPLPAQRLLPAQLGAGEGRPLTASSALPPRSPGAAAEEKML